MYAVPPMDTEPSAVMSDVASNNCDSVQPGGLGPDDPALPSASGSEADGRKVRNVEHGLVRVGGDTP
eukprot:7000803-Lingulodinium_polyedra.AAC.1